MSLLLKKIHGGILFEVFVMARVEIYLANY